MATSSNGSVPRSVPAAQNSLRNRQIAAIKCMLNFNSQVNKSLQPSEPIWKLLVYDKFGQDIISPLLTVKELRQLAITLYLSVDGSREPVPDAAAIYFVTPTQDVVSRLCRDLNSYLYESYHFNFITPVPRPLLEEVAKAAVDANCVAQVSKVYDQYLNFISLEDDLFITRHQDKTAISYYELNRPDCKDTDIQAITDIIADSLFSVFVTAGNEGSIIDLRQLRLLEKYLRIATQIKYGNNWNIHVHDFPFLLGDEADHIHVAGVVPIIRCPRGNAAEMVAETLDKKIRDNLRDPRTSMFTGDTLSVSQIGFSRPLLIILDRTMDLATPLHHTWTYQALAHDVFDLQLNRITIPQSTDDEGSVQQAKSYDLHGSDGFWRSYKGSPFPEVADAVQSEVTAYKAKETELSRLRDVMGASNGDDSQLMPADLSDSTAKLTSAITSLPELMEKKKSIDMHTNIATSLLDQIKKRKLDLFFEIEDKLLTRSTPDKPILDILTDPSAGEPEDKLRLFLIYYILSQDTMPESELEQYLTALESMSSDTSPVHYIKKWKALTKMAANPRIAKQASTGYSSSSMSTMFQHLYTSGTKMMEGVRNFVIRTKDLPFTRIVDQLMEMKVTKETEDFRYFDPKLLRGSDSSSSARGRGPFQEAYVFVVGGGNYIEYQNLQDHCSRQQAGSSGTAINQPTKRITYGTTELMDATEFLAQLSLLGKSID